MIDLREWYPPSYDWNVLSGHCSFSTNLLLASWLVMVSAVPCVIKTGISMEHPLASMILSPVPTMNPAIHSHVNDAEEAK